jgi:hypothetical protein
MRKLPFAPLINYLLQVILQLIPHQNCPFHVVLVKHVLLAECCSVFAVNVLVEKIHFGQMV